MTRVFAILMKFAKGCADASPPVVTEDLKQAAQSTVAAAVALRSENAIVYIGNEPDGSEKYFGSKEAVTAWVKQASEGESRAYRAEDMIL